MIAIPKRTVFLFSEKVFFSIKVTWPDLGQTLEPLNQCVNYDDRLCVNCTLRHENSSSSFQTYSFVNFLSISMLPTGFFTLNCSNKALQIEKLFGFSRPEEEDGYSLSCSDLKIDIRIFMKPLKVCEVVLKDKSMLGESNVKLPVRGRISKPIFLKILSFEIINRSFKLFYQIHLDDVEKLIFLNLIDI
ncbi:unnamed protein product [Protopolystoma xenopodis]|uniref:Uncharacterized protein n=1 Tax=Protopolystoma xenopodis TaxID=117903 RepID=A0A3S5A9C2_9PLAT|nr:unnamed protein product [Protopolystoma xenopodis]